MIKQFNFRTAAVSALAITLLIGAAHPSSAAERRVFRDNAAGGETAAAEHAVGNGEGQGYVGGHRLTTDGKGNGVARQGSAWRGKNSSGVRGGVTAKTATGTMHESGFKAQGVNGGTAARQGSTTTENGNLNHESGINASGAKGSISSNGSMTDTNGQVNQQRSTTLTNSQGQSATFNGSTTGTKGDLTHTTTGTASNGDTYNGSTTTNNGNVTHDTVAKDANGDTYTGTTTYTKGEGFSHTGSCTDANGNAVACPSR